MSETNRKYDSTSLALDHEFQPLAMIELSTDPRTQLAAYKDHLHLIAMNQTIRMNWLKLKIGDRGLSQAWSYAAVDTAIWNAAIAQAQQKNIQVEPSWHGIVIACFYVHLVSDEKYLAQFLFRSL